MNRIERIQESHPNLSDDDVRLLLIAGYVADKDMDEWTETIKDIPLNNLMNTISFIKSQQNGN